MSKYEELKYVLSGATDWGYEYAKKEDVEAAFAELEERHAMELDQWVQELGKIKLENERLKKSLFNVQKAASNAKLSAHEKSRRIDELKAENEKLKTWMKEHFFCEEFLAAEKNEHKADLEEERRWRKFPEEKPSEELEGEDFLVSNGYYQVVCEWRGYWNNEPFCGDKNCDVVKFWMPLPPMEEK